MFLLRWSPRTRTTGLSLGSLPAGPSSSTLRWVTTGATALPSSDEVALGSAADEPASPSPKVATTSAPSAAAGAAAPFSMSNLLAELNSLDSKGVTLKTAARGSLAKEAEVERKKKRKEEEGEKNVTEPNAKNMNSCVYSNSGEQKSSTVAAVTPSASETGTSATTTTVAICSICGKKFSSEALLENHMRVRHRIGTDPSPSSDASGKRQQQSESRKRQQNESQNRRHGNSATTRNGNNSNSSKHGNKNSHNSLRNSRRDRSDANRTSNGRSTVLSAAAAQSAAKIERRDNLHDLRAKLIGERKEEARLKNILKLLREEKARVKKQIEGGEDSKAERAAGENAPAPSSSSSPEEDLPNPFDRPNKSGGPTTQVMFPHQVFTAANSRDRVRKVQEVGNSQTITLSGKITGEVNFGYLSNGKFDEPKLVTATPKKKKDSSSGETSADDDEKKLPAVTFHIISNSYLTNANTLRTSMNKSYVSVRCLGSLAEKLFRQNFSGDNTPKAMAAEATRVANVNQTSKPSSFSSLSLEEGTNVIIRGGKLGNHPVFHMSDTKWSVNAVLDVEESQGGGLEIVVK